MHDENKIGVCRSGLDISTTGDLSSCFCSMPFKRISINKFENLTQAHLFLKAIEDEIRWNRCTNVRCKKCVFFQHHKCQGGCLGYKISPQEYIDDNFLSQNKELMNVCSQLASACIKFNKGAAEEALSVCKGIKSISRSVDALINKLTLMCLVGMKHMEIKDVNMALINWWENAERPITESANLIMTVSQTNIAKAILLAEMARSHAEDNLLSHPEIYLLYHALFELYRKNGNLDESTKYLLMYYKTAPVTERTINKIDLEE